MPILTVHLVDGVVYVFSEGAIFSLVLPIKYFHPISIFLSFDAYFSSSK